MLLKKYLHKVTEICGLNITKSYDPIIDQDADFMCIYANCKDYTMTSKERMYALYTSVKYIIHNDIRGDFVECGVWKGGSAMIIAHTLLALHIYDRRILLYDTYSGMTSPHDNEHKLLKPSLRALEKWHKNQEADHNAWCYASLAEVKKNMHLTQYPQSQIIYIEGDVKKTLPQSTPSPIALLRLDTDWYASTKHELTHLYPLLSAHGVLIIDDYGDWSGAQDAVDEYFSDKKILLNRVDRSGRVGIKT